MASSTTELAEVIDALNWESERFPGDQKVINLGAGDTYYLPNLLETEEAETIFETLTCGSEVQYYEMFMQRGKGEIKRVPRLQMTQACFSNNGEENLIPIYRYPSYDQSAYPIVPISPSVDICVQKLKELTGHEMNHCVLNFYRDGKDSIGFHSDKQLDIKHGTGIASLSLGQERIMRLRNKKTRKDQLVLLKSGSVIVIGPETNKTWMHSVPKAHRNSKARLSLTIREIGTYFHEKTHKISGQGESHQTPLWPFDNRTKSSLKEDEN